jgi:hypothetical protein
VLPLHGKEERNTMTYPVEPPLTRKSPAVLHRRFRQMFGEPVRPDEEPSRRYRLAVVAALKLRFGTPTPDGLYYLIDEAGRIGVHPEELAEFVGRQFKLAPMRRP